MTHGDKNTASWNSSYKMKDGLRWLYGFVRPRAKEIALVMGMSVISSALVLLQPWLTKLLIDNGILAKDFGELFTLAMIMVGVGLFGMVLSGITRYQYTKLSGTILFDLRSDVYGHLQKLSPLFYAERRVGDTLSRLDGDISEIQRFAVDSLFSALSNIIGLVGALTLMMTLSWKLSLIVLVLIPSEFLWLRWMRKKVERRTRDTREKSADISSFLVETLPFIKFIQSSVQEDRESKRLRSLNDSYLKTILKLQVIEFFTNAVPGMFTSVARATSFLIGGWWVIQGDWQLGSLIAFSTYLGMSVAPVNSLLGLYVAMKRMAVSLDRVSELRFSNIDVESPADPLSFPTSLKGSVEFRNVTFSYPSGPDVLKNLNIYIPPGKKVALMGASGSGKSTLIDLIQRHFDPHPGGQVLLDGVDLRKLQLSTLRSRIATVSQDTVIFKGSLADNIRYSSPESSLSEISDAAMGAQLGELIDQLPNGLETTIGERGQKLSGGQKQRISIARALLQNPAIIILDEATSAVDEVTERQIIKTVDKLFSGRTRIIISHRQSTLEGADLTLEIEAGLIRSVVA